MTRTATTVALSALLSTSLWGAPSLADEFSAGNKGSGETPRAAPGVEFSLRDFKPVETPQLTEGELPRAAPMDEASVVRSMIARGRTAGGKDLTVEPGEALRGIIAKQLSGESDGGGKKSGGPSSRSDRKVIGDDDRVEITDTEEYPFRMVGQILFKSKAGSARCSGALIGPRTVLTAAHCLYSHDDADWTYELQFVPGLHGDTATAAPFGIYDYETSYILSGYLDNYQGDYGSVVNFDLGVLILKDPIGDNLGWMGYGHYDDLAPFTANIAGYPGDMPSGTMWFSTCDVTSEKVAADYFLTECDTFPGSSGSAVYWLNDDDEPVVVGVNVAGTDQANTAVRLNAEYLAWVKALNQ